MQKIIPPIGISDFSAIREEGYYYIDKTGLICDLVQQTNAQVTLIIRPRRFGKTMGMYMLADFFDIRKNSKKLFDGLKISKNTELCSKWMNQYPTLFLTFKNVDGLNFSSTYTQLSYDIGHLFQTHGYLQNSDAISKNDKQLFERIQTCSATQEELIRSI